MEKLHMQYDVIMKLNFYDFENILNAYGSILDERRKAEEDESKKHGIDEHSYSPDTMMRNAQKNMPKIPNVKIPKF